MKRFFGAFVCSVSLGACAAPPPKWTAAEVQNALGKPSGGTVGDNGAGSLTWIVPYEGFNETYTIDFALGGHCVSSNARTGGMPVGGTTTTGPDGQKWMYFDTDKPITMAEKHSPFFDKFEGALAKCM